MRQDTMSCADKAYWGSGREQVLVKRVWWQERKVELTLVAHCT